MMKVCWLCIILCVTQHVFGDVGTHHIIKAKIIFQNKEHIGYFKVWGYLYLKNDSLKYEVEKFTSRAKSWVYGDTIQFYSEIISLKDRDLTVFPVDKLISISKEDITNIYPLELIEYNSSINSATKIRSNDKSWIFNHVQKEDLMRIEADELCNYTVLYYKEPNTTSVDLVNKLEKEIRRGFDTGEANTAEIASLVDRLKKLKVIILTHCNPS